MMHLQSLMFLALVAYVSCASISGSVGIDRNGASALAVLKFPKIPGINAPLITAATAAPSQATSKAPNSTVPPATDSSNGTTPSSQGSPDDEAPEDSTATDTTNNEDTNPDETSSDNTDDSKDSPDQTSSDNTDDSKDSRDQTSSDNTDDSEDSPDQTSSDNTDDSDSLSLPDFSELPQIPGLSDAIEEARSRVAKALGIMQDLGDGIQKAVDIGLNGSDPAGAIATIVSAILSAYTVVAENCPLIIAGAGVMREANQLVADILQAANRNVTVSVN